MNRAPSPRDPWWAEHQRNCGGTYTKIKEPEGYGKKNMTKKDSKGKSENEGKGMPSKGTLPRFFERRKRENSESGEMDEAEMQTTGSSETRKKRHKTGETAAVNTCITPFSGAGHILGTKSHREFPANPKPSSQESSEQPDRNVHKKPGTSTMSNPKPSSQESSEQPDRNVHKKPGTSTITSKTPPPNKNKRFDPAPTLTIIDAFKRGKEKSDGTSVAVNSSPVQGSHSKPINILDDSPQRNPESMPLNKLGPCPVCQTLVVFTQINQHLDSCLQ